MAIGHLTITLHPAVDAEEFEKFAAEELVPHARTVVPIRIGRQRVRHTLLREDPTGDGSAPRTYLWRIEQKNATGIDRIERCAFATDIGTELKARLETFGTLAFGLAEERFGAVIAQSDEEYSTPTEDSSESDPRGWVTPQSEDDRS